MWLSLLSLALPLSLCWQKIHWGSASIRPWEPLRGLSVNRIKSSIWVSACPTESPLLSTLYANSRVDSQSAHGTQNVNKCRWHPQHGIQISRGDALNYLKVSVRIIALTGRINNRKFPVAKDKSPYCIPIAQLEWRETEGRVPVPWLYTHREAFLALSPWDNSALLEWQS